MTRFDALLLPDRGQAAHIIRLLAPADYNAWLAHQPGQMRASLAAHRFAGKAGSHAIVPVQIKF